MTTKKQNSNAKEGIPLASDGSSSKTVVAVLYKLGRSDDKFDKELKKVFHPKAVVSRGFVENFNKDWEDSGKHYEIDEEATKEYYVDCKLAMAKRTENKTK